MYVPPGAKLDGRVVPGWADAALHRSTDDTYQGSMAWPALYLLALNIPG